MSPIAVSPMSRPENAHTNTIRMDLFVRIRILDVVTGKPLRGAILALPQLTADVIRRSKTKAMRVCSDRNVSFRANGTRRGQVVNFDVASRTLRTFAPLGSSQDEPAQLALGWQCVEEVFEKKENGSAFVDTNGNVFQQVNCDEQRYVCERRPGARFCDEILASNEQGELEIPVSIIQWLNQQSLAVELRDYVLAAATGAFVPENRERFVVSLQGEPVGNDWRIAHGSERTAFSARYNLNLNLRSFVEIRIPSSPIHVPLISGEHLWSSARSEPDVVVWAVRRVQPYRGSARTASHDRTQAIRGVAIHYCSGYFVNEVRGTQLRLCRDAYDSAATGLLCDNGYFASVELCLQMLRALHVRNGPTTNIGYHYHIERNGTIQVVVGENRRCAHAGQSREPTTVSALRNTAGGTSEDQAHVNAAPASNLNQSYIGINVVSSHLQKRFHFAAAQLWYLDRLIENIRARNPGIAWHRILGHDEMRAAYNAANPSNQKPSKPDPGTALPGGMGRLRGRHGAFPA